MSTFILSPLAFLTMTAAIPVALAWEYPLIKNHGPVEPLPDAAMQFDKAMVYSVVFDITKKAEDNAKVNPALDHVARFVNLLALSGIKAQPGNIVAVLHGKAAPAVLQSTIYKEKLGSENPNLPLLSMLRNAGVKIYVCGQTLAEQKLAPAVVHPDVIIAFSAIAVTATCQLKGYAYLPEK
ncbi:MAG: DsrE family protein [Desulfobacteraceae bacterium]|nr:DsrE family protein [Desulfobacteraceae bacterium]